MLAVRIQHGVNEIDSQIDLLMRAKARGVGGAGLQHKPPQGGLLTPCWGAGLGAHSAAAGLAAPPRPLGSVGGVAASQVRALLARPTQTAGAEGPPALPPPT